MGLWRLGRDLEVEVDADVPVHFLFPCLESGSFALTERKASFQHFPEMKKIGKGCAVSAPRLVLRIQAVAAPDDTRDQVNC